MLYGYGRVSTYEQNLSIQMNALQQYGVESSNIYTDKSTGINTERKGLQEVLSKLSKGDKLVILRIDRIARNVRDLLNMLHDIEAKGAGLVILNLEGKKESDTGGGTIADTTSPMGKFMITTLGAIAELEYNVNREKQLAGIEVAKKKGKYNGRPKKYTDKNEKLLHALDLYENTSKTVKEICNITGIGRTTLYENIKEKGIVRS